jgi:vitamin B12 transporter
MKWRIGTRALAPVFFHLLFVSVIVAATLAVPASAQDSGAMAPVEITAARTPQALSDALPSVTVITREDIDATQSRDLVELLGRQAGIEFTRSGGQGSQSSLFVRGTNSNQILVLVNGVPINSVALGAANLSGLPTDDIERIEIARGNLSSIYGADAIGGVVQIFTRGAGQAGADALVEAGQGRTRGANASVSTPVAGAMLSLSAGYRSQQAITSINLEQVPGLDPAPDGNWNRHGTLRLDEHGAVGDFSVWAWGSRNDTQWLDPFNASATIALNQIQQVQQASQDGYGISGAMSFGDSKVSLSASQSRDDSNDVSNVPNTDPYTDADNDQFRSRRRQLTVQDTTTLVRGIEWVSGVEHVDQDGAFTLFDFTNGNTDLKTAERRVDSLWTGTVGHLGSQQWQINLRHDRYSDFGGATTGLLGWGWSIDPAWKLTAQASTGFRAPSFEDLYYPIYGNPALLPERARTVELGLRWSQAGASASAAIFRNRVSNLIEGLAPSFQSINVGHAAMDGIEGQAVQTLGPLRLAASLNLDRPRDQDTGLPLLRRADANLKLSAGYVQGPWSASADWQRTGARDDLDILTGDRVQLSPYNLARLALRRDLGSRVQVFLRLENLFNANYQLVDGYNTLPRMIVAGVEARL